MTTCSEILTDEQVQQIIDQVKAALPHLGEGYIDLALQCYDNNVDTTIAVLLENEMDTLLHPDVPSVSSSLHPRLRGVDPSLSSFFTHSPNNNTLSEIDTKSSLCEEDVESVQAREIQKQRIRHMVQRQKQEAAHLEMVMGTTSQLSDKEKDSRNEFQDDDGSFTEDDDEDEYSIDDDDEEEDEPSIMNINEYDAIRTYNRVTREMEAEEAQWEASRNVNRVRKVIVQSHNDTADDENSEESQERDTKYRGLDKGKGGRLLGPDGKYLPRNQKKSMKEETGSVPTSTTVESPENTHLSEQQKRRKNNNKAKRANHNRRDRAARKTGIV